MCFILPPRQLGPHDELRGSTGAVLQPPSSYCCPEIILSVSVKVKLAGRKRVEGLAPMFGVMGQITSSVFDSICIRAASLRCV